MRRHITSEASTTETYKQEESMIGDAPACDVVDTEEEDNEELEHVYEAKKEVERVEKNREIYTNAPYFVQVRDDWRYMPTDAKLAKAYVLGQRTSEEKW
jgi:hypothetical protein